jgi:phage protein D
VGSRGGESTIEQSFNQRKEIVVDRPIHSKKEAETLALETLERISKDMVKGTGSTVGLPDLRAGSVVMMGGLGTRFSGRYFVTSTTHAISDSGYTTQFECRREELKDK